MNKILRVYTYDEFIEDYGQITILDDARLITENGIKISFSKHFETAYNNELVSLDYSSLKNFYYVLSSDDSIVFGEKVWHIYIKQYLGLTNDNSHFILIQNIPNYKILRRRNFCKILIQTDESSFFELYKMDVHLIKKEKDRYNSYTLKTNRGNFTSTYTTLKFLYALIEIFGIDSNDRTYILYNNGNYESITNEPILKNF